jgi:hypothetical protein
MVTVAEYFPICHLLSKPSVASEEFDKDPSLFQMTETANAKFIIAGSWRASAN